MHTRSRYFFVSMAVVLLVIVAGGFARSFYFRSAMHPGRVVQPLPGYIVVHGVVLTLWFLLFLVQTLLVSSGRVRLHRSLGVAGAALAAVLVPISMLVVVRSVVRETALVVFGDMALMVLFAALIIAAIRYRQRPEVHKRLMLVASISIVAPAIARWPGALARLPLSVLLPQLLLFAAVIVHDLWLSRKVYAATAWGLASYIAAVAISLPLAASKFGHTLFEALK